MRRDLKKHGYRTTHKITDYCKCGRDSNYDITLPDHYYETPPVPNDPRPLERKRKTKKVKESIALNTKQNEKSEQEYHDRINQVHKDLHSLTPFIKPVLCKNYYSHITLEKAQQLVKQHKKYLIGNPTHRHKICNPTNHYYRDDSNNEKKRIEEYQLYQGEVTNDMLDCYS